MSAITNLSTWLNAQTGGVNVYHEFRKRAQSIKDHDGEHAAVMRLLLDLANDFIWVYAEEPLSPDIDARALTTLKQLVSKAAQSERANANEQMRVLNEIAQAELTNA